MLLSGKTETGKIRKTNQDAYDFGRLAQDAVFAVVCDGMGGANGGNVASSLAVKIIAEGIKAGYKADISRENAEKLLNESVKAANTEVFAKSRSDYELNGMGTTVEACIVCGGMAYTAHAGDSRIYYFGSDGLRQLTRDHSIVQEMVENGKITPEEAVSHPQKNIITRALGVEEELETDFGETAFCPGDTILICSDGLTNQVSDSMIETELRDNKGDGAEKLVDMANENGGSDNITVVLIKNV